MKRKRGDKILILVFWAVRGVAEWQAAGGLVLVPGAGDGWCCLVLEMTSFLSFELRGGAWCFLHNSCDEEIEWMIVQR